MFTHIFFLCFLCINFCMDQSVLRCVVIWNFLHHGHNFTINFTILNVSHLGLYGSFARPYDHVFQSYVSYLANMVQVLSVMYTRFYYSGFVSELQRFFWHIVNLWNRNSFGVLQFPIGFALQITWTVECYEPTSTLESGGTGLQKILWHIHNLLGSFLNKFFLFFCRAIFVSTSRM